MTTGLCWLLLLAQNGLTVAPEVRQGGILSLTAPAPAVQAEFLGRKVPLFPRDGVLSGLLPVPALTKPGRYELRAEDSSGAILARAFITVLDAQWEKENLPVSQRMSALRPLPGEVEALRQMRETVTPSLSVEPPLRAPVDACINAPFGVERLHNGKSSGRFHAGIDHRAASGEPIRAAADGIVLMARRWRMPGGTVGIDHGQGVVSVYLHQSRFAVKPGQFVRAGQVVGYVGMTGFATGPHLHWSLYVHGVPVNPAEWTPGMPSCRPRN